MSLSPEQLERRLAGISATDVSAIVGVNPYRSRIDVWREKRGEAPPWIDTERSRWGELLEPVVRRDYADRHGVRVETVGTLAIGRDGGPLRGEQWMLATPDGIVFPYGSPDPDRGLEIKCHTWRVQHLYGAPGSDEVPLWELCQCMWGIAVTGLHRWDLVPLIDLQPAEYVIDRDEELIGTLADTCEKFLVDNVRGGAVPEPDGSGSFDEWLKLRWKSNPGALVDIGDDNDTFTLIETAKDLHARIADDENELATIVQRLKLKIADHEGLTWKDARGRVERLTWKRNKSSLQVASALIARDVRDDARLTLSGAAETIDRAMVCLDRAGYEQIGSNTRAAISAREVFELVQTLARALVTIAERTDNKYTTEIPGARPFCWPRSWAKKSTKEQNG